VGIGLGTAERARRLVNGGWRRRRHGGEVGRHCEIANASKEGACGAGTCPFTHAHAETASWPMHARKPRGVRAGGRVALRPRDTRVDAAHRCCAGGGAKNRWVRRDVADASVRRAALQLPSGWHGQSAGG
jgi:hypothetical protein